MGPFTWTSFINHLRQCNGCTGARSIERCRFALQCATAEVLNKKGLIVNQEELMCSNNFSKCGDLSKDCDRTSEVRYTGMGPCENKQG